MDYDSNRFDLAQATALPFGAPEWPVLRARLGAQWVARRALAPPAGDEAQPCGSFNSPVNSVLTGQAAGTHSVNPTALGYGKPNHGTGDAAANVQPDGGRG